LLDEANYPETIAEVAAPFVGLAALVTAVQRSKGISADLEWIFISRLVERGLAAVAFALIPQLLHFLGYELQSQFHTLSAVLAVYFAVSFARPSTLKKVSNSGFSTVGMDLRVAAAAVMIPIRSLAAFRMFLYTAPGPYVLGCTWLVLISGVTFASVLALPPAAQQSAAVDSA
jgi:hypothetical protein